VKQLIIIIYCSFGILSAQGNSPYYGRYDTQMSISSADYITGEDGIVRMYVNVWGHVKNPGTYLVYDGIDILTLMSLAGGPLLGAKLSDVQVFHANGLSDGSVDSINLDLFLKSGDRSELAEIGPHDTIFIEQSLGNYLLTRVNLLNTGLQIINILYTVSRLN